MKRITGTFTLMVKKNGVVVHRYRKQNMVVNGGFEAVQKLLSDPTDGYEISQISFGGYDAGDGLLPPAPEWTDVPNPILIKDVSAASFPTNRSVSFSWVLLDSEGNGNDISYFGLHCTNDDLFAVKAREPITKTSDITLEGAWVIRY